MNRGKRGQITIFILIMLLVGGAFMFIFFLTSLASEQSIESEADRVLDDLVQSGTLNAFVSQCLDRAAEDALIYTGYQGGNIFTHQNGTQAPTSMYTTCPAGFFDCRISHGSSLPLFDLTAFPPPPGYPGERQTPYVDFTNTGYFGERQSVRAPLCYLGGLNAPFLFETAYPFQEYNPLFNNTRLERTRDFDCFGMAGYGFQESTQAQLQSFIAQRLSNCTNWENFRLSTGYNVTASEPAIIVKFNRNDLTVTALYPIEVDVADTVPVQRIVDFSTTKKVRLHKLMTDLNEVLEQDNILLNFNLKEDGGTFFDRQVSFAVTTPFAAFGNYDDVITIIDNASKIAGQPYIFKIVRGNRIPVLDNIEYTQSSPTYDLIVLQGTEIAINPNPGNWLYDPDEDLVNYFYVGWKETCNEKFNEDNLEHDYPCENPNGYLNYEVPDITWTDSDSYQLTFRNATYVTTEEDIGPHNVTVYACDQLLEEPHPSYGFLHTLSIGSRSTAKLIPFVDRLENVDVMPLCDWQKIKIMVLDIPELHGTGYNNYSWNAPSDEMYDLMKRAASPEDSYVLDGSGTSAIFHNVAGLNGIWKDSCYDLEIVTPTIEDVAWLPDSRPSICGIVDVPFDPADPLTREEVAMTYWDDASNVGCEFGLKEDANCPAASGSYPFIDLFEFSTPITNSPVLPVEVPIYECLPTRPVYVGGDPYYNNRWSYPYQDYEGVADGIASLMTLPPSDTFKTAHLCCQASGCIDTDGDGTPDGPCEDADGDGFVDDWGILESANTECFNPATRTGTLHYFKNNPHAFSTDDIIGDGINLIETLLGTDWNGEIDYNTRNDIFTQEFIRYCGDTSNPLNAAQRGNVCGGDVEVRYADPIECFDTADTLEFAHCEGPATEDELVSACSDYPEGETYESMSDFFIDPADDPSDLEVYRHVPDINDDGFENEADLLLAEGGVCSTRYLCADLIGGGYVVADVGQYVMYPTCDGAGSCEGVEIEKEDCIDTGDTCIFDPIDEEVKYGGGYCQTTASGAQCGGDPDGSSIEDLPDPLNINVCETGGLKCPSGVFGAGECRGAKLGHGGFPYGGYGFSVYERKTSSPYYSMKSDTNELEYDDASDTFDDAEVSCDDWYMDVGIYSDPTDARHYGIDNDGNGYANCADPVCYSPNDNNLFSDDDTWDDDVYGPWGGKCCNDVGAPTNAAGDVFGGFTCGYRDEYGDPASSSDYPSYRGSTVGPEYYCNAIVPSNPANVGYSEIYDAPYDDWFTMCIKGGELTNHNYFEIGAVDANERLKITFRTINKRDCEDASYLIEDGVGGYVDFGDISDNSYVYEKILSGSEDYYVQASFSARNANSIDCPIELKYEII